VYNNRSVSSRSIYKCQNWTKRKKKRSGSLYTIFADAQRVTYAGYTVLTPMPGTELHASLKDSIVDFDLRKYNFFNCVLKTKLPIDKFHEKVGALWLIKKGDEVA
jgi:hypothetical protein